MDPTELIFNACSSTSGKILLGLYAADKVVETALGELAKKNIVPSGSILGLLGLLLFRVLWSLWSLMTATKKLFTKENKNV